MNDRSTKRTTSKDKIKARMKALNGLFLFQSLLRESSKKFAQVDKSVYDDCNDKLAGL